MPRVLVSGALILLGGVLALVLGYLGFQAYLKWLLRGQTPPVKYE